jgi:uncharacterized protein YuzB (UPF0349 family)
MIKICKHNTYSSELEHYFKKNSIAHSMEGCLGDCKLCHEGAFVQIEDRFVSAPNTEELIKKLSTEKE